MGPGPGSVDITLISLYLWASSDPNIMDNQVIFHEPLDHGPPSSCRDFLKNHMNLMGRKIVLLKKELHFLGKMNDSFFNGRLFLLETPPRTIALRAPIVGFLGKTRGLEGERKGP